MNDQSCKNHSPQWKFVIPGKPIPLARGRYSSHGKVWDAQKQAKFGFGIQLVQQLMGAPQPLLSGPLFMEVTFYFEMPASRPKCHDSLRGKPHIGTPDISNLLKFVEDASERILFPNDSIIAEITAKKCYDDIARTEFIIMELK